MIGRLKGELTACAPTFVLLDVGGVGYELQIPLSTFYALNGRENGEVVLHVHTHVREDALQLYGFATRKERVAFQRFLGVSGVGPRLALAVLSGIGVEELEVAVVEQDRARLQQIPGIGRKTAERLLLELKDKLGAGRAASEGGRRPGAGGETGRQGAEDLLRQDAVSALINLGYTPQAADRAVGAALARLGAAATLEQTLKDALGVLVR